MVKYTGVVKTICKEELEGFFVGWSNKPSAKTHLELLRNSDYVVVAVDDKNGKVVGFITAITNKVLSAYIPFLEVLPEYRQRGIGKELVNRMLKKLKGFYMVDLICDKNLEAFYSTLDLE